jgi:DEAD/DEAH box helicase domain-containing protein
VTDFCDISAVPDEALSNTIVHTLRRSRNIKNLYTHQVAAINAIAQGKNVIVSTSTASGKSVIYQVWTVDLAMLDC